MSTIEVILEGAETRTAATVPTDQPVGNLMATLVLQAGDGPFGRDDWFVATEEGHVLDLHLDFTSQGVDEHSVLRIARRVPATDASVDPALEPQRWSPPGGDPFDRAARILPRRLDTMRRAWSAMAAAAGFRATHDSLDAPPLGRARSMWHWTDYRRRLMWMIRRPELRRTAVVGVCRHSEPESGFDIAAALVEAFDEHRSDRTVAIHLDGRRGPLTRASGHSGPTTDDVLNERSGVSLSADSRFGDTSPVVITAPLAAPLDAVSQRRVLQRILPHAGIVVLDCGPEPEPGTLDLCDVLIVGDRRLVAMDAAPTPAVIAVDANAELQGAAIHADVAVATESTPVPHLEVATLVVKAWVDLRVAEIRPVRTAPGHPRGGRTDRGHSGVEVSGVGADGRWLPPHPPP